MATGGYSGEMTNRQYVELGRAISRPNMESIALGYLNIDQETIDSLKVTHRENPEAFNREVLRAWAYKYAVPDQVKVRGCFVTFLVQSVMPKPVYLLTVQEAHKEYSSLTDQIRAKYEQLDSGEFGSPDTPAFDAEACELAKLLARVSQLCQRLNLPMPKELYRPMFFKH